MIFLAMKIYNCIVIESSKKMIEIDGRKEISIWGDIIEIDRNS